MQEGRFVPSGGLFEGEKPGWMVAHKAECPFAAVNDYLLSIYLNGTTAA